MHLVSASLRYKTQYHENKVWCTMVGSFEKGSCLFSINKTMWKDGLYTNVYGVYSSIYACDIYMYYSNTYCTTCAYYFYNYCFSEVWISIYELLRVWLFRDGIRNDLSKIATTPSISKLGWRVGTCISHHPLLRGLILSKVESLWYCVPWIVI